ncbi:MAG: hypothetical protein RIC80_00400 [Cyclobacteriaceae bacterium]
MMTLSTIWITESTKYPDSLDSKELLAYNTYLDGLTEHIESLEHELDEYLQEAINEIVRLRIDLERLTKSQAERQVRGTWWTVVAFLTKSGLNDKEINTIVTKDWETIPQGHSNSFELAKTILG